MALEQVRKHRGQPCQMRFVGDVVAVIRFVGCDPDDEWDNTYAIYSPSFSQWDELKEQLMLSLLGGRGDVLEVRVCNE